VRRLDAVDSLALGARLGGMADFDEAGWWAGRTEAWPADQAWTLFAREDDSRMLEARWRQQAKRFFGASVSVAPSKDYPGGGQPRFDRASVAVGRDPDWTGRLTLQTFPADHAEPLRCEALALADGGMDTLIQRSPRIWQWRRDDQGSEPRAELLLAALLASVLLGPVWAPGERGVFGVRGARERLARL